MNLYYYTNVETMRYVLQNANIYATNLGYMNDAEEYANGVRELREIFNKRRGKELITEEMLQAVGRFMRLWWDPDLTRMLCLRAFCIF